MEQGTSTLVGGMAAALVLPFAVLVLGFPLWLGALIAAGVFAGSMLALKSRGFGLKLDDMAEAQADTVRGLIEEGGEALARLSACANITRDPQMRTTVYALVKTGGGILDHVKEQPGRAMAVRRFLTFYLPNAASIAEGWCTLEGNSAPSPQRIAQTRDVMLTLKDAFAKFETMADAPELQELDLSLKVVKDSLKADLEKNL